MNHVTIVRFYTVAKVFYIWSGRSISTLENCNKMKFRIQLHLTLVKKIKHIVTLEWFCDV